MSSVITCNVNGHTIALDIDDVSAEGENLYHTNPEFWRARRYANYEPDAIAWIDKILLLAM